MLLRWFVAFLVLLGCGVPLSLQAQQLIQLGDSTSLSSPPWSGTLGKFVCQKEGLQLQDTHAQTRGNVATLFYASQATPIAQWEGRVSFRFGISRYNHFYILLAPTEKPYKHGEVLLCHFVCVAPSQERAELQLVKVPFSYDATLGWVPYTALKKEVLIAPSYLSDESFKDKNREHDFFWRVSFTPKEGWRFSIQAFSWAHTQIKWLGSTHEAVPIRTPLAASLGFFLKYSKGNARAFTIHYLRLSPTAEENPSDNPLPPLPTPQGEPYFALHDASDEELLIRCLDTPDVTHATARFTPSLGRCTLRVEQQLLVIRPQKKITPDSYTLELKGVRRSDGTLVADTLFAFDLHSGEEPQPNPDIELPPPSKGSVPMGHPLLSEVLPHAHPQACEFVELYNPTDTIIDLSRYAIGVRNEGRRSKLYALKEISPKTLEPHSYRVICPWKAGLVAYYAVDSQLVSEVVQWPALPNNEGQLFLYSVADSTMVEEMYYGKELAPRGKLAEGLSMERRSFLVSALAVGNWQIAATPQGATPGRGTKTECNLYTDGQLFASKIITHLEASAEHRAVMRMYSYEGFCLTTWHTDSVKTWAKEVVESNRLGDSLATLRKAPYILAVELYSPTVAPERLTLSVMRR